MANVIAIWKVFTIPQLRYAGIALILLPVLIMGQTMPESGKLWENFHSFGIGGTSGQYGQTALYNEHEGGCGTIYDRKYYEHDYGLVSLNYENTKQLDYTRVSLGVTLFAGSDTETELGFSESSRYLITGAHPYFNLDSRWFGIGLGLSLGALQFIPINAFDETRITSGLKDLPAYPNGRIRFGPYDIIDLEYKVLDEFPTQMPLVTQQLSIGSGFGLTNGTSLRIGLVPPEEGWFISGKAVLSEKYVLQARYISFSTSRFSQSSYFVSLGLSYRLFTDPKPAFNINQ